MGGPITVLDLDVSDEAGAEWIGRPERPTGKSGTNDRAEVMRTRPIRKVNEDDMLLLGNTVLDVSLPESLAALRCRWFCLSSPKLYEWWPKVNRGRRLIEDGWQCGC